jgi:hypothetical protein
MEKENTRKNSWSSKRKLPVEDPHKQKLIDLYREPDIFSEISKYEGS